MGKRAGQNVLGYRNMILSFSTKYGAENIRKALLSLNVDYDALWDDFVAMEAEARNLNNNIESCKSKTDLLSFAEQIDQNIPKLVLVRRSWCLGV